jgi:catechol 2,3-dioxygenase-like lactoylglutathione lyase family enzyme
MIEQFPLKSINTILYCKKWQETVTFYRDILKLPVFFSTDWFIEFQFTSTARLSIADERRSRIKSSAGTGITLTLQVDNASAAWHYLHHCGVVLGPLQEHPWQATVFYFFDPEGYRLEIWSLP